MCSYPMIVAFATSSPIRWIAKVKSSIYNFNISYTLLCLSSTASDGLAKFIKHGIERRKQLKPSIQLPRYPCPYPSMTAWILVVTMAFKSAGVVPQDAQDEVEQKKCLLPWKRICRHLLLNIWISVAVDGVRIPISRHAFCVCPCWLCICNYSQSPSLLTSCRCPGVLVPDSRCHRWHCRHCDCYRHPGPYLHRLVCHSEEAGGGAEGSALLNAGCRGVL